MKSLLGFDIGSSSVKASLIAVDNGSLIASATSPSTELPIHAEKVGWAEQDPDSWWEHAVKAAQSIAARAPQALKQCAAIGISYQMHGLVCVDKDKKPLRRSIIWCDSRAVSIGEKALEKIGRTKALAELLNSPGNFTASKLRWVRENEPEIYRRIWKVMLPGDYIAMRMTGEACTTPSGLSEGVMWSFTRNEPAASVLEAMEIDPALLPNLVSTFAPQGAVTRDAARELGVPIGIPVSYRAGDQPNNAFSLNVLHPGEFATTAGTSGVVYGVGDAPNFDPQSRVNTFLHVTHENTAPRYGTLLCCNGTGCLYSWIRRECAAGTAYDTLNAEAAHIPAGSDGVLILPYGNGAERSLGNRDLGASVHGINFNRHTRAHLVRAAQEGIVFSLNYGLEIMREMKNTVKTVRAGNANLFLSPLFREVFSTVTGAVVELYETDGAQGAARGAGVGASIYSSYEEAFRSLRKLVSTEPTPRLVPLYKDTYRRWKECLSGSESVSSCR